MARAAAPAQLFTGTISFHRLTLMSQSEHAGISRHQCDRSDHVDHNGWHADEHGKSGLTVSGLATFSGGTISGSGAVNANGGILFSPTNATFTLDGRTLTNPAGQTGDLDRRQQRPHRAVRRSGD